MKLLLLVVACVVLMAEVVRSGGSSPVVFSGSCTPGQLAREKQGVIHCLRQARTQESGNGTKDTIILDTADCIADKLRPTGSDGIAVNNLKAYDLLLYTHCSNECFRKYLKATSGCTYQNFYTCLIRCFSVRINSGRFIPASKRAKRSVTSAVAFKRVDYMSCYLPCITPTAVMRRGGVPIPASPGCSVDDHVRSADCRNLCLNKHRNKRNAFEDAAKSVPALVNLMHSHCVSDCLSEDDTPQTGSCKLLDVEQFEFCLNKCILKTNMMLPP